MENSLSVLLGRAPGPVARGRGIDDLALPPVPAGLPSDLLRRRPDLREAEQRMIAANERIGVAMTGAYPRLSLTAVLGLASDDLSTLATSDAGLWSVAAGLTGPIFTAGRVRSEVEAASAVERQAVEGYLLAILTALRESEDALVTRSTTIDEAEAQRRQTEALAQYADLANRRYDNGYVGYLEVLDAERDLFDAELNRVRLRASLCAALVGIYKAFGGGWVSLAEAAADDAGGGGSTSEVDPTTGRDPEE
ncbi:MAG: TolC family protein [Phycisphaerales bacterium]|nr:TolC family protein [Phycisphaerales bacterium]